MGEAKDCFGVEREGRGACLGLFLGCGCVGCRKKENCKLKLIQGFRVMLLEVKVHGTKVRATGERKRHYIELNVKVRKSLDCYVILQER